MDDKMFLSTGIEPEEYEQNIVYFMTNEVEVRERMALVMQKMFEVPKRR